MTTRAQVVIGSNYGDEGKGLLTDYYAAQAQSNGLRPVVARFNGGAQAGHTVVAPNGDRHVFGHFGAGSLVGARTMLTSDFIVNPILFVRERAALITLHPTLPDIFVDTFCPLTTPWDMRINQVVEAARGSNRHGSVGVGINETVTRTQFDRGRFVVRAGDSYNQIRVMLRTIKEQWVPARCGALNIDPAAVTDVITSGVLQRFMDDVAEFKKQSVFFDGGYGLSHQLDPHLSQLIFEGAQGLGLDEHTGVFPYVTRSNTGLQNVVRFWHTVPVDTLDVTYVTRCYLTRHGAGPLEGEEEEAPFAGIIDTTNLPHEFQGTLRFALLDITTLRSRIMADFTRHGLLMDATMRVAVTCLDQAPDDMQWRESGDIRNGTKQEFLSAIIRELDCPLLVSTGPTRDHISQYTR